MQSLDDEYLSPKEVTLNAKILLKLSFYLSLCLQNSQFQCHLFEYLALVSIIYSGFPNTYFLVSLEHFSVCLSYSLFDHIQSSVVLTKKLLSLSIPL